MLSRKWEMRIPRCGLVSLALDFGETTRVLPEKADFKEEFEMGTEKRGRSGICPGKQEILLEFINMLNTGSWAGGGLWYLIEEERQC